MDKKEKEVICKDQKDFNGAWFSYQEIFPRTRDKRLYNTDKQVAVQAVRLLLRSVKFDPGLLLGEDYDEEELKDEGNDLNKYVKDMLIPEILRE
ncbi:MAG: hypothetical protein DRJ13_02240 [Bacteroidetes bacterium]|nr:MAG: hypothetical protein DRJ13_02240 [Bacteroidota bacterium]